MMMKKIIALMLTLIVALAFVACGDDKPEKGEVKKEEGNYSEKSYFKNDIAEIEDVKIEITDVKVIPVGNPGNEDGEKPVIAFWYKVTNKTDKDISPSDAWMAVFSAYQDNDPNRVNELDMGMSPDDKYIDTSLETIKKDGTVEDATSYELDDLETPVLLKATKGFDGKEIGSKEYSIK